MTLSGFANKFAQLYIVTKGASLLQNTPRRDGDLLYNFNNYIVDDANYTNSDYDAYSTGMVVLSPPASGQKVSIYYKNPLNQTDGAPIWVSLRLSDHSLTPQNTLHTPYISGDVDLNEANQLGVSSDERVVLTLPTDVPPPLPTPVPNAPYYFLDDNHRLNVSFQSVPPNQIIIAFTDPPDTGYFYFFFLFSSSTPGTLEVTCDNAHVDLGSGPVGSNSTGTVYRVYGHSYYASLNKYHQITLTPNMSGTATCRYVWSYFRPIS